MEYLAREISSSGVKEGDLPFSTEDLMISEISEGVSFFDSFCRRISKEDVKEGPGVDIKVFFSFLRRSGKGVFDLGFCGSDHV